MIRQMLLVLVLWLHVGGVWGAVQVSFDAQGLEGVRVGEVDYLADARVEVSRVVVADRARNRNAEAQGPYPAPMYAGDDRVFSEASLEELERHYDSARQTLDMRFAWGRVSVTYGEAGDRLDFAVEVVNDSQQVIEFVELRLLELTFPGEVNRPALVIATVPHGFLSQCNLGGPDLWRAVHADQQIMWLSLQPNRPLRQRLEPVGNNGLRLTVSAGGATGGREIYDGLWDSRSILPGETDHYALSARFAPAGMGPYALAADVLRAFGEAAPQVFRWNDRRPIGAIHIGDARRDGRNPRGWFLGSHDESVDAASPDYDERVREWMLAAVPRTVEVARRQGMQGVIVWQIEGMQEPGHAYYGEPRILPYVAPEMDAVADAYFAGLRAAGLRVGVCVRPPIQFPFEFKEGGRKVVPWPEMREAAIRADWSVQFRNYDWVREIPAVMRALYAPEEAWSALARLDHKIRYAKERWGATLFYLDTNYMLRPRTEETGDWDLVAHHGQREGERAPQANKILTAELLEALQRLHPDVLVISEWQYLQYWAVGGQYTGPPSIWQSGPDVRLAYPEAMTVLSGPGINTLTSRLEQSVATVMLGDVVMGDPVNGSTIPMIDQVYGAAAMLAPFQVVVREAGIDANGVAQADAAAFQAWLEEQLPSTRAIPPRRVFVRYEEEVPVPDRQAVFDAVALAGGILSWSAAEDGGWTGFWGATHPLRAAQPAARSLVFPDPDTKERAVRVLIANASDEARVLSFKVDAARLGVGAQAADDVLVAHLDSLWQVPTIAPPQVGGTGLGLDRPAEAGLVDDLLGSLTEELDRDDQRERERDSFVHDETNVWYEDGEMSLKVPAMGFRSVRIRRLW